MSYFQYCYLSSFVEEVKRQTMNQKTLHSKYINIRFHVAYLFRQTAKCFFDRSKPYHFCSVISSYQINEWFVIMIQWLLLLSSNWDTVYYQKLGYTQNIYALFLLIGLLNTCSDCHNHYCQKQDGDKKLTITFAQNIWTVRRKSKRYAKLTLSLMPAWEIAITPVHTQAFRRFSASAAGIASLSSWLVANRFSISDSSLLGNILLK